MASLLVVRGPGAGRWVALPEGHTVIGSDPACAVHVPSPHVGPRHARVTRRGDRHTLEDLGGPGGTFLDLQPVEGPADIPDGGSIALGDFEALFVESPPRPMSDDEWLASADPRVMLASLAAAGPRSDR